MGMVHLEDTGSPEIGTHFLFSYKNLLIFLKINWNARLVTGEDFNCYRSVDGSDLRIYEPTPFSPDFYSHKFHSAGLGYEIIVSIYSGTIVWALGHFSCGSYSGLRIFRLHLKQLLQLTNEKSVVDFGYRDEVCITSNELSNTSISSRIRARKESTNGRMKHFFVLSLKFRHSPDLHSTCFFPVLNLTHLLHCPK